MTKKPKTTSEEINLLKLRNEYKNYLMQRMLKPQPHLTFKKFLAGKRSFDLLEFYDSIRQSDYKEMSKYCFSGQISFGGCFAGNIGDKCNPWTEYETYD